MIVVTVSDFDLRLAALLVRDYDNDMLASELALRNSGDAMVTVRQFRERLDALTTTGAVARLVAAGLVEIPPLDELTACHEYAASPPE